MTDRVCITLGNEGEAKRSLRRLRTMSLKVNSNSHNQKKKKNGISRHNRRQSTTTTCSINSIEIKATASFRNTNNTDAFDNVMNELMQLAGGLPRLLSVSMKLLPQGLLPPVPTTALAKLFQNTTASRTLQSLVLVNVTLGGDTLRLKDLAATQQLPCLECLRLVSCGSHVREASHCLSHLLSGIASIATLKSVVCTNCSFAEEDLIVAALGRLLRSNNQLESLTLKNCHNILSTTLVHPSLVQALQTNSTLQQLTFDPWGAMCNTCLEGLGEVLRENKTLHDLSIDGSDEDMDWMPLAVALETNRTLVGFHLLAASSSHVPDQDVQDRFTKMLQTNFVLQHVGVAGSRAWNYEMDYYLRLNRVGRLHLFDNSPHKEDYHHTNTKTAWSEAIISCHVDTPVVFELLSRNPSILTSCIDMSTERKEGPTKRRRRSLCSSDDDEMVVPSSIKKQRAPEVASDLSGWSDNDEDKDDEKEVDNQKKSTL